MQLISACGTIYNIISIFNLSSKSADSLEIIKISITRANVDMNKVYQTLHDLVKTKLYTFVWDQIAIYCHCPTYISSTCNSVALLSRKANMFKDVPFT